MNERVSRRHVLGAGSVTAAALLSGAGVMLLSDSDSSLVSASMDGFSIQGASAELAGEPSEIPLTVEGHWVLHSSGEHSIDSVDVDLFVEYGGNEELLAEEQFFTPSDGDSEDFQFTPDLLDHPSISPEAFDVDPGEEHTTEATARLVVQLAEGIDYVETVEEEASFSLANTHPDEELNVETDASGEVVIEGE